MKFYLSKAMASIALIIVSTAVSVSASAQGNTVKGTVTDETGLPMIGLTVIVSGTNTGVTTDADGKYEISVPSDGKLTFSYLGYISREVEVGGRKTIDIQLFPDTELLEDAIVIGYGTTTKKDLTGSISSIDSKEFNSGLISSPEQLINGKVSGVQILSGGGSPTSGSTIRIRGGASLNASNNPLFVIDGVPLENGGGGISGIDTNPLSLINPNDIESMTILKDASSTAIYGSRASNGVVIITTKRGSSQKLNISFTTTESLQTVTRLPEMLSRDEFIATATAAGYSSLLGRADTNWSDEIYKNAFGTDNSLSVAGQFTPDFPFRVSLGYYNQDGIVRTDNATRYTGSITLSPYFFDSHLKLTFSAKGAINTNRYAPAGSAIYNATVGDPTRPVYSGEDRFGGFSEIIGSDGTPSTTASTYNPLGLLMQTDYRDNVKRVIANADADYSMHFLPELRIHATLGMDYSGGSSRNIIPDTAASDYRNGGLYTPVGTNTSENRIATVYLNYSKELASAKSRLDATVGYDYQYWRAYSAAGDKYKYAGYTDRDNLETYSLNSSWNASDQRHVLMSYYARVNYSYDSRYLVTATIRRDGSSRFAKDKRWGTFPSVALAWNAAEESFLKGNRTVSTLKLRASYGVTGQQDGIGNYYHQPIYYPSGGSNSQYITDGYGNYGSFYIPGAYDSGLTWETTASWNFGIDFGFFEDRLTASVDYYTRKTSDLLATVPAAAGTNFSKTITTNVGNVAGKGVEASINAIPVQTKDWTWNISANMTWSDVKITNLSYIEGVEVAPTLVGSTVDGKQVQTFATGQTPYAFYVYKQIYDENGRPIEGAYADLDGNGEINIDDRYFYHSPNPDFMFGLSTSLRWKRLSLSTALRANLGNYAYNATAANNGALETMKYADDALYNLSASYLQTGFKTRQHYSDHYVENASFIKMDNLTLSYDFGKVFRNTLGINLSLMVQNVFTITKYSGVDPEISLGIDQNFYPRPRIYSISLGLNF